MGSRCLNDKDLNYLEFAESFLLIFPCDYSLFPLKCQGVLAESI